MLRVMPFLVLLLAFVLTTSSVSQEKDKKPKGMLPFGWKDLGLSAEQKAKVYTIQAEYKTKTQKLEDEIKALKAQEKTELVKVLTPEQKAALTKALTGETKEEKKEEKK